MNQGADDGHKHSERGHIHSATRRLRMAQSFQAEDEQDRGEQVTEFNKIIAAHQRFSSFPPESLPPPIRSLNILSIRSVIINPPTTLIIAEVTAIKPRNLLRSLYLPPAVRIEPTTEIAEMALVADINGVCNRGGTREMT